MQLVDIYRGEIVDVTLDSMIVQIVGSEDRVDSLIDLLSHFGILEMVRTGPVAWCAASAKACTGAARRSGGRRPTARTRTGARTSSAPAAS